MTLKQPNPAPDDPRLAAHVTVYQASRGGWLPKPDQPVPGAPKEND